MDAGCRAWSRRREVPIRYVRVLRVESAVRSTAGRHQSAVCFAARREVFQDVTALDAAVIERGHPDPAAALELRHLARDSLQAKTEELRHVAAGVTVAAGLLMVSRLRYNSFKGSGSGAKGERVPFAAIVIAVAVIIALVIDPPRMLFAAAVLYALSGPVLWLRRRRLPAES